MGHRANLIIVDGDRRTLYYDHWCASRLDAELFWGPQLALDFITALEPVSEPDGWLDSIWCEGAALVDVGRSVLTWFGGSDVRWDVLPRRAHLALMAHQWPGWQIRWAHEGILSIADELGLPRAGFRGRPRDAGAQRAGPRPLFFNDEFPEDNLVAIGVRLDDGQLLVGRLCGDDEAFDIGPALIDTLLAHVSADPLLWDPFPQGGVHIDRGRRTIDLWWALTTDDLVDRTCAAWPDWTVTWHRDRYERQVELSEGKIALPAQLDLRTCILESLALGATHEGGNPAPGIAAILRREGHTVDHINPATNIARGSVGELAHKRAVLAALTRWLLSTA